MNTIAIIGSCDTKYREIAYMREQVESQGMKAMVINVATGPNPSYGYDVSRDCIYDGGSGVVCGETVCRGED